MKPEDAFKPAEYLFVHLVVLFMLLTTFAFAPSPGKETISLRAYYLSSFMLGIAIYCSICPPNSILINPLSNSIIITVICTSESVIIDHPRSSSQPVSQVPCRSSLLRKISLRVNERSRRDQ
jgi:hypothetical protein